MRVTRLTAFLATSCLTAGWLVLAAGPASAVVPQCLVPRGERGCVSITSALPASNVAIGVDARRPAVNSKIVLSPRLSNDANQDFRPLYVGTVRQIENENPGLLNSAVFRNGFANDPVYEFGTVNPDAPLCIGIAAQGASSGVPVVLRTCGVSAGTLWVIAGNQPDHDAVFLNGASSSALFALTAVRPARIGAQTAPVTISRTNQRIIQFSQLWNTSPSI